MKKMILASILTAVAVMAQTNGTAPKTSPAPAVSPAPATATAPKPVVKKHSKVKKNTGTTPAVKPAAAPSKDAPKAPAAK